MKYQVTADCKNGTKVTDTITIPDSAGLCDLSIQHACVFEMCKRYPLLRNQSYLDIIWNIVIV